MRWPGVEDPRARRAVTGTILFCALLALATGSSWMWGGDLRGWGLMGNTLRLSLGACLISLPLGALAAILIWRTDLPLRRLVLWVFVVLLFVPLYLQVAGWDAALGKQGWYSLWTESLARPPLHGMRGAVWVHAMAAVPWVLLLVGVGLRFVEPELEEQAVLDAGNRGLLFHVLLPRVAVSLLVAALWVLVQTASEMTIADMYLVPTYAREVYTGFALGDDLSAVGRDVLPGMTLVLSLVASAVVVGSWLAPPAETTPHRPARRMALGGGRWLALAFVVLLLLLVVGLPLGSLVYKAGMVVRQVDEQRVRIWMPDAFWRCLAGTPGRFTREYTWTGVIGVGTCGLSLLLAAPLAWWARRAGWSALPALLVVAIGLAVPTPLTALGLIALLDQPQLPWLTWLYDDTVLAPVLALTVRALPLSVLVAWYGVRSLPGDVLDSALVEGASRWGRFWKLAVPLRGAAWALAGLVAFVLATGDVTASILVVPPGVMTVAVRTFGLIHSGVDDQVAGLSLTSAGLFAGLAAVAVWLVARPGSGSLRAARTPRDRP